jgi:hypothetical protein
VIARAEAREGLPKECKITFTLDAGDARHKSTVAEKIEGGHEGAPMLQDVLRFSHPGAAYDTATSTRAMRMYGRTVLFKRDMRSDYLASC